MNWFQHDAITGSIYNIAWAYADNTLALGKITHNLHLVGKPSNARCRFGGRRSKKS